MAAERRGAHRGLYWAAVLLSIVLLCLGSVLAYLGYTATSGPDGAVSGYFSALERGDAAGALAFGDLPNGPHTLLTGTVLKDQQRIAPIRDVQILSVQRAHGGRTAVVTVHYDIDYPAGAQQVTDQVPVHRRGSSWYLDQTAVATTIDLTHALDRASIVGAGIPEGATLLFPGVVPVSFDTPYLQLDSASVTFSTGRHVEVAVGVSDAGRAAVTAALSKALAACVHSGGSGVCPLPSDRYVPGSLKGRLEGGLAGRVSLTVDPDAAGVIDVSGVIPFRGSYEQLQFDNLATARSGTLELPLDSVAYAVAPIVLQWTANS